MSSNPSDVEEERVHFANVLQAFKSYGPYALAANNRRRKDIFTLSKADQDELDKLGYKQKLADVDKAIMANAEFVMEIVANPEIFGHGVGDQDMEADGSGLAAWTSSQSHSHWHDSSHAAGRSHSHAHSHSHNDNIPSHSSHSQPSHRRYRPTDFDMDKLRSTLKQLVRDWSKEGEDEREACYRPMKDALLEHFSDIPEKERRNFRVLVPGAGLGRLAFDIAKLGFACQGNEFSHYMLLTSYFILNRTEAIEKYTIYPYVHSFSNMPNRPAMLRSIPIPDVLPSDLPPGSDFSLVAGDFEEIYGSEGSESEPQAGQWDAVLTCFFLDTAKNIVNYVRILHRILTPGGVWINIGPLLWHWENNNTNDPSIELDLEELKALCTSIGFDISNERTIQTTYTNNAESMLGYIYDTAFWTATKIV